MCSSYYLQDKSRPDKTRQEKHQPGLMNATGAHDSQLTATSMTKGTKRSRGAYKCSKCQQIKKTCGCSKGKASKKAAVGSNVLTDEHAARILAGMGSVVEDGIVQKAFEIHCRLNDHLAPASQVSPAVAPASQASQVSPASPASPAVAQDQDDADEKVNRVKKTDDQKSQLLKQFAKNPYPTRSDRQALGVACGLSEKQIQSWFVYQRKKNGIRKGGATVEAVATVEVDEVAPQIVVEEHEGGEPVATVEPVATLEPEATVEPEAVEPVAVEPVATVKPAATVEPVATDATVDSKAERRRELKEEIVRQLLQTSQRLLAYLDE